MRGEALILGAYFGVVEKPLRDFLITFHQSYFKNSSGFLTNRLNIAKKRDFGRRGHFDAK